MSHATFLLVVAETSSVHVHQNHHTKPRYRLLILILFNWVIISGMRHCCIAAELYKMVFFAVCSTTSWVPCSSIILERKQTSLQPISPKPSNWHKKPLRQINSTTGKDYFMTTTTFLNLEITLEKRTNRGFFFQILKAIFSFQKMECLAVWMVYMRGTNWN